MTRFEFIRSAGRWFMLLLLLAAGGFLFASRRVSHGKYCAVNADCANCGLNSLCKPAEENKVKSDEEE